MALRLRSASLCAAALLAAVPLRALAGSPAWAYRTAAGDRLRYKLDYRSLSELNFGGLLKGQKGPAQGRGGNADNESAPEKVRVTIKADLQATTVAHGESGN